METLNAGAGLEVVIELSEEGNNEPSSAREEHPTTNGRTMDTSQRGVRPVRCMGTSQSQCRRSTRRYIGWVENSMEKRACISQSGSGADIGISITLQGSPSTVQENTVLGSTLVDMSDNSAACGSNIWKRNTFQTDLVADVSDGGPGAGCIR